MNCINLLNILVFSVFIMKYLTQKIFINSKMNIPYKLHPYLGILTS